MKSGESKFFSAPELGPLTSNLLHTPINLPRLWDWCTSVTKRILIIKIHKIWSVDSQTAARDLGSYIDSDLSMKTHVQRSVARCFAVLPQLRCIRRVVPSSVYQSLVVALVLLRLDSDNATMAGLPACLLNRQRLQSIINAAARSIAGLCRSKHITDALASFHWLRAPERIKFKLAVIVYRALHGTAPHYLSD